MDAGLRHGSTLFNCERFFEAHEALEDIWREAPRSGLLRRHLQGLVQMAVAFHHYSTGNFIGARSVLERAVRNLDGAEQSFPDLDLLHLRASLGLWRKYLAEGRQQEKGSSPPALPKLIVRR
jgi:hypothetical protein